MQSIVHEAGQNVCLRDTSARCCSEGIICCAYLQDDRLQDAMEELRGRFKAVVAAMGLHEGYFPREAGAGMTF